MPTSDQTPGVTVLLATYNGRRWLPEQVESILNQEGVRVRLVALDDGSTDGTAQWLAELAELESRVTLLRADGPSGSSAANFYRLAARVDVGDDEFIAFADQDDVWQQGKLSRHAAILAEGQVDGVSSSVTAFDTAGRRNLIKKDYPQREFDFLLESPGPGSTFLLTPRLARLTAELVREDDLVNSVEFHDSLIYAIARGRGWRWHIDGVSSVDYRQHDDNVMGSNTGFAAARERWRLLREHWLRNHAVALARVALRVAPAERRAGLEEMLALFEGRGIRVRLALARRAASMRRRPRDQRIIALLIAAGVW